MERGMKIEGNKEKQQQQQNNIIILSIEKVLAIETQRLEDTDLWFELVPSFSF